MFYRPIVDVPIAKASARLRAKAVRWLVVYDAPDTPKGTARDSVRTPTEK